MKTFCSSSLEKKSLLRDNVDLLVSLADVYFRAGDTKNAILKFEQAQMLDPYLIRGESQRGMVDRVHANELAICHKYLSIFHFLTSFYFHD